MKKLLLLLPLFVLITSCDDKPVVLKDSAGRLNDILVVATNKDWEGVVGDSIRSVLARPIDGIVREEPLFTLNHIKPKAFDGLLLKNRNYLIIEQSDSAGVSVKKDKYANPQIGVVVKGSNSQEIAKVISENGDNIVDVYSRGEVAWKNYLMNKTKLNTDVIKERFGIDITVPRTYRYAAQADPDFFWLRRSIEAGTMDIMIYEVDYAEVKRDSNTIRDIIKVRDRVGGEKIPVDEGGLFKTEANFTPLLNETQIDGRFAFETRGNWEVVNMFMAGPFINYTVYNKDRNNWLVLEGYVSAPNSIQRNYLFELEAILRSARFGGEGSIDD